MKSKLNVEVLSGAAVAFSLKVIASLLSLLLGIVIARLLGADGAGIFYLTLTVVTVLSALGRLGFENVLIKKIAIYKKHNNIKRLSHLYKNTIFCSFVFSFGLSITLYLLSPWLADSIFSKEGLASSLELMALSIVSIALLTLHANSLQGLKEVAKSLLVLSVFVPFLSLSLAVILIPLYGINGALSAYLISTILTLVISRLFWVNSIDQKYVKPSVLYIKKILKISAPLYGIVMINMYILWMPVLLLGIWVSSKDIGVYVSANRTAALISFILVAINSIAAPKFAELFEANDLCGIEKVAHDSVKLAVVMTTPVLLLVIIYPEGIMSIFGAEFEAGGAVLILLSVGHFINVLTGSVGYILMMTGNERLLRKNLFFIAFIGTLAAIIAIPKYGIYGAAFIASLMIIVNNIISVLIVWKKINIITIPYLNKNKICERINEN